jgi:hypothetical protein
MRISLASASVIFAVSIGSALAAPPAVQRPIPAPPRVTPAAAAGIPRPQPASIGSFQDKTARFRIAGGLPPVPAPDLTVVFGETAPAGTVVEMSGMVASAGVPITGARRGLRMWQNGDHVYVFYRTTPAMKSQNIVVSCDVSEGTVGAVVLYQMPSQNDVGPALSSLRAPVTDGKLRFLVDPPPESDGMLLIAIGPVDVTPPPVAAGPSVTGPIIQLSSAQIGAIISNIHSGGQTGIQPLTMDRCRIQRT